MVTPRAQGLHVVGPADVIRPKKALTLAQAIAANDYLAELYALRRTITAAITNTDTAPRDLAALTRRQMEISKEIRAQEAVEAAAVSTRAMDAVEDGVFDPEAI